MADKIYFGVPGAIEEIPAPESGMGFNNNVDANVTSLVSGGRSVYRAPTAFKSFNLNWKGNSSQLRHLINLYNGQYGSGPFYLSDPTTSDENVLPARWSNTWQLAYQSNGWGKPVVQDATPTNSPSPSLPRTNKIVKFTQATSGSVPTSGVLRTRVIRIPGKPYYFSAYGSATGGAGIRVRAYNNTAHAWGTLATITDLSGWPTQVITEANTYTMIEIDIYLPLGSTLTLYGMSLGTFDHTVLRGLVRTNLFVNPSFETNVGGFSKSSVITLSQASFSGAVYSGTKSLQINIGAGAAQFTWMQQPVSIVANQWVAFAANVRWSGNGSRYVRQRIGFHDSLGAQLSLVAGNVFAAPDIGGGGSRYMMSAQAPAGAVEARCYLYFTDDSAGTVAPVDGTSLQSDAWHAAAEATQEAAELSVSNYFDGDRPDEPSNNRWFRWLDTANASSSVELNEAPTDYMPVGQGVGPLQFDNAAEGSLSSKVIDRIGLSLDMTEVQNVESRAI